MGYVLREGETAPPPELQEGLRRSNRLQDWTLAACKVGRTAGDAGAAIVAEMAAAGWRTAGTPWDTTGALSTEEAAPADGRVYSHPIGEFMHSAGPGVSTDRTADPQTPEYRGGALRFRPNTWMSGRSGLGAGLAPTYGASQS